MIRKANGTANGFTIVELLIVIVVIGILAAITIVAYNGVSNRAKVANAQSDLEGTVKIAENARAIAGTNVYPSSLTGVDTDVTYTANAAALGGYCATEVVGSVTYMVTATNTVPHIGPGCTTTNIVTNPSFENASAGITTGWVNGANASISSTSANGAANGTYAGLVTHINTTAGNAYIAIPMTTVVGKQYALSFAIKSVSASIPALTSSIHNTTVGGSAPGDASSISITPTAAFTRYTTTWTAESTTTYFDIDISGTTAAQTYAIDSVMATEGNNAGSYVDPLTVPTIWTWSGTVGASTSSGPAF
jgi:prepilin-type N-terminal cleavage/methylation domain-containing protein